MNAERGSAICGTSPLAASSAPLRAVPHAHGLIPLLVLVAISSLLYSPARGFDRIELDDPQFLFDNPNLNSGVTRDTIRWALTNLEGHSWRPLANVVHLLAFTVFGPNPGAHHVLSVGLFIVTVAGFFAVLRSATKNATLAFVAAALWAWHPLRVENVCWLTETAGPLAGLFCVAALGAYVAYARRGGVARYALVALCFVLAMMAKPTLPAFPIALLAFDLWPLGRIETTWTSSRWRGMASLVVEKLPLLAIALAFSVFTAGRVAAGAGFEAGEPPVSWAQGLFAVPAAYAWTLLKTVWPVDLSVHYPWMTAWSRGESVVAAIGLVTLTALIIRSRSKPLLAGWCWFGAMLLPMLVASRYRSAWVADRYTYLPHMMLMAAVAAAMLDATARAARPVPADQNTARPSKATTSSTFLRRWGILGTAMVALIALSARQVLRWQDSETLFVHSLAVCPDSELLHHNFGVVLDRQGRLPEAKAQYARAVAVAPRYVSPRVNLGILAERLGDYALAERELGATLKLEPNNRAARFGFARLRAQQRRPREAAQIYEQLAREYPNDVDVFVNFGAALEMLGDRAAAEARYRDALRINPRDPDALANLNRLLAGGASPEVALQAETEPLAIRAAPGHYASNAALAVRI